MNTRKNINRLVMTTALAVLGMTLCGCDKNDYGLAFSHNLHVTENGMACTDCHGELTAGHFTSTGHAACADCHEDAVESRHITEDTCGVCHKVGNIDNWMPQRARQPGKGSRVFVHTEAMADRCAECHGALLGNDLRQAAKLTRDDRIRIRQQSHRSGMDCAACHVDMDRGTPPTSHDRNWPRRHGARGMEADNVCGVCHSEESCRECHQVTMPTSHNNLWRVKTHGIQAAWDRERCLVCHQQDSCAACHADTRPVSHAAGWRQNHCFNCHPGQGAGTGCSLCHDTDIGGHSNPHSAGWRNAHCNSCHPGTPATEQCGVCHVGGTDINSHPDPHPAGWRNRHCDNCHAGSSEEKQCAVCHGRDLLNGHPNPHSAGWRSQHCDNCHAGSSEEQQCAVCHGGDLLNGHPNPHSAGWRSRHCDNCHAGSSEADECAVCHEGGNNVLVHESFWPEVHNRFGDEADCSDCH